ncbi:putative protease SohB [wastewater metagenome]|uniref:Putative protease SohB n=2 Tax=unclassified sequences TaxID=12908 RepID=A0A5B8RCX4_9ZZZZ|nr:protease SohB [Arhodomonas aquaeolei]MCS4502995.1 protease SohB [Arhodomonas aquaeolei]QEA06690.1 putative protease SohB [uncultured organism]
MAVFQDYALFLAELATIVLALVAVIVIATRSRGGRGERDSLRVRRLNERYEEMRRGIERVLAPSRKARRRLRREGRRQRRRGGGDGEARLPRVFVLDFDGDIRASAVESLREEVSAVLRTARSDDEVVLRLESGGGTVPSYGLAASQLARLRENGVRLTVCVDRIAASGGYLMAAVADHIVAAPFAIVGSIGVVAQLPNLHRLLKRHDVDYELHTAGEYKRTLSVFGENTDAGRAKFREELDAVHGLFKQHIARYRPGLDVARVATGEYWLGSQARELGLVDAVGTSDDLLLDRAERMELIELTWQRREPLSRRLSLVLESALTRLRA